MAHQPAQTPTSNVAASAAVIVLDEAQQERIGQLETQPQFAYLDQLWLTITAPIDRFPILTTLRSLNIQYEQNGQFDSNQLAQILLACNRLEELSIAVAHPVGLDENILNRMQCPLHHLALYDVEISDTHLHVIVQKWRDTLRTFILTVPPFKGSDKPPFTADGMRAITNQCANLITFECNGDCVPATTSHLADSTFYFAKILHLVELCLDGNPYITDGTLDIINFNCASLTRLSLSATGVSISGVFRTVLHFNLEVLCCDRIAKQPPLDSTILRAIGMQLAPALVHFEIGLGHISETDTQMIDEVIVFALRCTKLQTFGTVSRHLHERLSQYNQLQHVNFKPAHYPTTPSSVSSKFGGSRLGQPAGVTATFRYTKRV